MFQNFLVKTFSCPHYMPQQEMLKINPPTFKGRVLSTEYSKNHKPFLKLLQIMSMIKCYFSLLKFIVSTFS